MKPGPFTYHDPGTVAEVVALLANWPASRRTAMR